MDTKIVFFAYFMYKMLRLFFKKYIIYVIKPAENRKFPLASFSEKEDFVNCEMGPKK